MGFPSCLYFLSFSSISCLCFCIESSSSFPSFCVHLLSRISALCFTSPFFQFLDMSLTTLITGLMRSSFCELTFSGKESPILLSSPFISESAFLFIVSSSRLLSRVQSSPSLVAEYIFSLCVFQCLIMRLHICLVSGLLSLHHSLSLAGALVELMIWKHSLSKLSSNMLSRALSVFSEDFSSCKLESSLLSDSEFLGRFWGSGGSGTSSCSSSSVSNIEFSSDSDACSSSSETPDLIGVGL
mmetsp:Transcript_13842/g.20261  ORF Transcript_13842/g.20261 Transcript_13842/m.20261 type:complete len:241 (+) Transcript_13842:1389-2111(+)